MAIKIDLQSSQFGVPFAGAYFRVVTAAITREANGERLVMIDVAGYATPPIDGITREIDFRRYHGAWQEVEAHSGADFVAKCYAWVMAQPDMAGSVAD